MEGIRIGYVSYRRGVHPQDLHTTVLKTATEEKLKELIALNLQGLERMLEYNGKNGIGLLRLHSDTIPFGSHPVNTLAWEDLYKESLQRVGKKATKLGIRLSMHPGQYTLLTTKSPEVLERSLADLSYHALLLDSMGLGTEHKIILHVGGVYGNKGEALERFKENYRRLPEKVRRRLVVEHDEWHYSLKEVLALSEELDFPVVFDLLHHTLLPSGPKQEVRAWVQAAGKTWKAEDGPQKIHYSTPAAGKKPGTHAASVDALEFLSFLDLLEGLSLDIMLEVKDKNLSALKCVNLLREKGHIRALEKEWEHYKYLVLEKSQNDYRRIRNLLKDKEDYPALTFYLMLEKALSRPTEPGNFMNAAQHVWGYVKDEADTRERNRWNRLTQDLEKGKGDLEAIRHLLLRMAEKQGRAYLLKSYFLTL